MSRQILTDEAFERTKPCREGHLCCHNNNFGGEDMRYSVSSIERMVKNYIRLAGIEVNATPHTLRHSYARHLLNKGVDLRSIQELLGHSSIATTQIYTHITNNQLRNIHSQVFD